MVDIYNIIAALNLEYGANRRYEYQIAHSPFARLNDILEGVRRTEGGHIDTMVEAVKQRQAQHADRMPGVALPPCSPICG